MKDRKRVWDRRNIEKLPEEVEKFFETNIERFKTDQDKSKKKRKRLEEQIVDVAPVVDST